MHQHLFIAGLFLAFVTSPVARAASLPGNLTPPEIDEIIQVVGLGSATKMMRSAEAYREFFPGLKLGLEINVFTSKNIGSFGDQTGSVPGFVPMPRLYIAKSLFFDLEFIFSVFPSSFMHTTSSYGGILKWTFYNEKENYLSAAAYVGYTKVSAFSGDFEGSDIELGAVASKDYVRLRPYIGAGLLFASGTVRRELSQAADNGGSQSTIHAFIGAEFNFPINVTVQLDFMNLAPQGSLFFGKKF